MSICNWPFELGCVEEAEDTIVVRNGGYLGELCFDHACELERRFEEGKRKNTYTRKRVDERMKSWESNAES